MTLSEIIVIEEAIMKVLEIIKSAKVSLTGNDATKES